VNLGNYLERALSRQLYRASSENRNSPRVMPLRRHPACLSVWQDGADAAILDQHGTIRPYLGLDAVDQVRMRKDCLHGGLLGLKSEILGSTAAPKRRSVSPASGACWSSEQPAGIGAPPPVPTERSVQISNHSSSDVTGENVSGMDGHSLEWEANRGARRMRVAASIDIHVFLRSLRRLLHRITIESVPLSS
jgi:hypothetical protein